MQTLRLTPLLASALLAALAATLSSIIPTLGQIEEPWNIVVVSQILGILRTTFIVALAHAFILGIPLFLVLRSTRPVGAITCALGGFLVGSVPFGALALTSMFGLQSASTGGKATVVNGVPTLAGLIEFAYGVGSIGLLGLAGGLTFWVAMRVSNQFAGEPNATDTQPRKLSSGSWGIVSAAVVSACAMILLPTFIRDNSCHNLFRDGRTSVVPQISADINQPAEDWPALRQIFVSFGQNHSLSFRSDEQIRRGALMWRDLNLCNEAGVNIDAVDRPWLAQINSPLADRGIQFAIYEQEPSADWKTLARDLIGQIDTTWPQRTTFRGPDGKPMSVEDALKGRQ
jgi:hypothetical protein